MSCPDMIWYDMYSVKFELPMASFFKYICSFFAQNFVVGFMLQCFYVPIFLSRLFLRLKSVQKCSTAQSFTFPKFTSFKLGTLKYLATLRSLLNEQCTVVKRAARLIETWEYNRGWRKWRILGPIYSKQILAWAVKHDRN